MAGLSLGEYAALTVAGVFDFETGLRLVQVPRFSKGGVQWKQGLVIYIM